MGSAVNLPSPAAVSLLPPCSSCPHPLSPPPPPPSQCPVQEKTGCSEAGYPTAWADDKHFAKTGYTLNTVSDIQNDIMTRGSVTAAFTVYQDFLTYKSGVYSHKTGPSLGGHAVRFVGWGTEAGGDYWLVANSWNAGWGDNGFFKIKRGTNECGIESGACGGAWGGANARPSTRAQPPTHYIHPPPLTPQMCARGPCKRRAARNRQLVEGERHPVRRGRP